MKMMPQIESEQKSSEVYERQNEDAQRLRTVPDSRNERTDDTHEFLEGGIWDLRIYRLTLHLTAVNFSPPSGVKLSDVRD
jgi:hypothetical protein